jgi:hypothetical protein
MGYLNDVLKVSVFLILYIAGGVQLFSQTCCSGGVPLSGNIGFEGLDKGSVQMEISYDLNYLATLKVESETLDDQSRKRLTHSILLKTGYTVNNWLAFDALFTYVVQKRNITYFEEENTVLTNGLGDAVIIAKFIPSKIAKNGLEFQLGAGPKIPVGRTDMTDDRGIHLNADLQPGSGSWDFISWTYVAWQFKSRPTMVASARVVGRINGTNDEYLGSQEYKFGNSFQFYAGLGDQFIFGTRIISPSVSLRYRQASSDLINGQELSNTGGQWINFIPAIGLNLSQRTILNIIPEIPVYSRVDGVQLTPTFRIQVGLYHWFGSKKIVKLNGGQL